VLEADRQHSCNYCVATCSHLVEADSRLSWCQSLCRSRSRERRGATCRTTCSPSPGGEFYQ